MTNDSSKKAYSKEAGFGRKPSRVLGWGLVSAASALAGGLAVAWWYRKTLTKLQNPIDSVDFHNSESVDADHEATQPADSEPFEIDIRG